MTESEDSRARRPGPSKRVRIVQLDHPTLAALADGDLVAANRTSPVELTAYFVDDEWRRVWQLRAAQGVLDPVSRAWITGVIWDDDGQRSVGRAGSDTGCDRGANSGTGCNRTPGSDARRHRGADSGVRR